MERLPKSVDYSTPLATMPDSTVNYCVACTPTNGSSFTAGNTIIVDLNNVPGFLDPVSLSYRFKYVAQGGTLAARTVSGNVGIVGCPAYTPFLRVDVLANSSVVESVNNWNSLATMLSNITLDTAQKLGQQFSLGFAEVDAAAASMDNQNNTDGVVLNTFASNSATQAAAAASTNYIAAPILGISLSNAEKLVPLDFVNWRLQFTLDSLANIGSNLASDGPLDSYTISNFEVVYNQIQFPSQVHQQIKMQNPKIRIKTKSFGVGAQPIAAGSNGTINLYYNLRYASIRSLFLSCGPSATTFASKLMESVDPTTGNGSIQFSVGGVVMPQQVLSTLNNKAGILNELRRAMGSIYEKNNSMAIGAAEYMMTPASTISSITVPGKFYVGINCMKLTQDQDFMFSGVSSANSQINVVINTSTSVAAGNALTALLIANYDAIYEIDTLTRQMNYIQ
jgi:hypothetical protein